MKRIIYTCFMGILCALSSMGQPLDVVLNTAQQGNVTVQARNSITLASGYSYTPNGGTFLTQIVNPVVTGFTGYAAAIDQSTYSINTNLAVGKTPGELNISGIASYTIPFDFPKGSAGMQPNLSLNYTSTFNDGLLGIGWNIGGLSSISRVNQNLYFETQSNPIKGDLTDKYAIDGKRLIVTNGGTYGADGSIYGTELEEFSKITAKSSSGTNKGPAWFEVRTKSGLICEYGNTSDSKVLLDGTCILSWKVNKITDRFGNSITFTYFESDDERPILKIQYAGNTSTLAEVNFRYKFRSDISTYVYGGREFTRDILLDNIEVKNNGQIYKRYELAYMLDNYAQLLKITENSSNNQPFNPTVFTYTDQIDQVSNPTFYTNSINERFFQGDFNGDGRTDFVTIPKKADFTYTTTDKWKLYTANSAGNMVNIAEGNLDSNFMDFIAADFDGDGLCDLMRLDAGVFNTTTNLRSYVFKSYKSTGSNFTVSTLVIDADFSCKLDILDADGNGQIEILVRRNAIIDIINDKYYKLFSYNGGIVSQGNLNTLGQDNTTGFVPVSGSHQICDFNGDGCSDILSLFDNKYCLYEFKGSGKTLIQTFSTSILNNKHTLRFGDFNGDGTTDILKADSTVNGNWSMLGLDKTGFKVHSISGLSNFNIWYSNNNYNCFDVNADGKMDIIFWGRGQNLANSTNRINIAINKGNGYEYSLTEYISPVTFDLTTGPNIPLYFYFGDYNGDGRDEFFYSKPSSQKCFSFATDTPSNLLRHIIDGFGVRTQITYGPMSNAAFYTRGSGATYPLCDFSSAMQLVSQVDSEDGIGGLFTTTYKYEGAKIHLKGKGFLGFTKTTQTNFDTSIFTENNYSFDSPYYYPKLNTSYTKISTIPISTLTNTWDLSIFSESNRVFPYIKSSTQTDNLKNLSVISSVVYPALNLYGNPTSVTKSYSPGPSKTTSFLYGDERVSDWLIGRPSTITETSTSGSDSQTFTTTRTYFTTNNSPDVDQYNSGDGSYWQLNRDYDTFGNLWKEHKATTGLTETHTIYDYDTNGVNLMKVTDPLLNQTNYTWYPTTELLNTQTDPFGNLVTYTYNTADQLSIVVPSTGISTTITSSFNVSGGPTNARYYVDKTGNDGSQTKAWYDMLGRELRTETRKFGGTLVKVDKQYNLKGELIQYSEPTTGTASSWNVVGHDNYGRVNSLDPIFGPTTTYSEPYGDPTTTRIVNSRNYKTTIDATGSVIVTEDPGGTITNSYWPNGLLKSTLAPGSITTSMTYNKNGNRLTLADPSAGSIINTWYGTGQPKTTANADGQTTTYTYSPDSKVLLQSYASPEGTTGYTYYTNGLVNTITSPGGNLPVTRAYTYELGKVKTITETIDGLSNLVTFEYDSKGRLYKKYFNGTTDFEQYDYDTNSGYLYRIQFNGTTVWQMTNMDSYQRMTQANKGLANCTWGFDSNNLLSTITAASLQGYSYTFDANTGNLTTRTNSLKAKTETFGYDTDKLDRLTLVTAPVPGPTNLSIGYTADKNGNILSKSDAGTFVYDGTQPYAVDKITSGVNISTDAQDIQYYSFEKVKKITEGAGATQKTADFDYNTDHQRIRMVLKTNGTATKTRYYFGSSCEREVVGTATTQYLWIGGDVYTAVAVAKKVGTGSWVIYNIFRDHLGTITHLKNGLNAADEYSFDSWGRRRNATNWTYTLDANDKVLFADRGFTGHEFLADFNLYNMNGRLYDPVVGRFLSPDPQIQDPGFTQNMNRYSYCLNNPLKYNDQSGEFWSWPMVWLGNWAIGGLDRWINQKQSFKQAFSPTRNPVVFSTNYSPSANQFSHPQIDALKGARQEEKVSTEMITLERKLSGVGKENDSPWKAAFATTGVLVADDATGVGTVDDLAIPFVFAAATTYELTQRVFVTYTLTGYLNQKYAGRASGFGDPYSIMMNRYSGHHMRAYGYSNPTLDVWKQGVDAYPAIRGREQQLIDFYGGIGSPNVGNSIRGVGYYNPFGRFYYGMSNLYFGPLSPYSGF